MVFCVYTMLCCLVITQANTIVKYVVVGLGFIVVFFIVFLFYEPRQKREKPEYVLFINPDNSIVLGVYSRLVSV